MTGSHDDHEHDPLWAVTKPTRRGDSSSSTSTSADVATVATPVVAPAAPVVLPSPDVRRNELDEHLAALGIDVDGMPTVDLPITPAEPALDTAPVASPIADPDATAAVVVTAIDPSVADAADLPTDQGAVVDDEPTADVEIVDEPTEPVATGFAADPLATVALPVETIDERTRMLAMIPDTGNTAILTTPLFDPTPPNGRRVKFRRRRSWRRKFLGLLGLILMVVSGYYVISLFQVWSTGTTDHRAASQAIVVLGAAQYDGRPSPQLQARLDHAVELYNADVAPIVAVSGGKRPGDRFTEAETSRDYLVSKGVPAEAIAMENEGTTTWESIQNLSGLFDELGIVDVVIVTDPYHSLRSKLIAEELGLTAHVSPTRTSPVTGGASFWRHVREAAGVAVGRLVGFGRLDTVIG